MPENVFRHWQVQLMAWSLIASLSCFYLDTHIDFQRFGIVRCGPGMYVRPFGHYDPAVICSDTGLLDKFIESNAVYTFLFWLLISFVLVAITRVLLVSFSRPKSTRSVD
jgi:hypothetical protein